MTILFKEDWDKYPSATLHLNTTNQTFLRLATLYKDMGIKNNNFILALHNPELARVDPFNPNITTEEMVMIAIECKQNIWYYLREIARGPGSTIEIPLKFKANRGNISLIWLFLNHIFLTLIQPRQTGKSFSTDNLMTWLLNIRCRYTNIKLLTKDDKLRSANLERLKDLDSELPFYLKQRTAKDIANTEELHISSLQNTYQGLLPNRSPKLALNVGRGLTSPIFQVDEAAYLANIALIIPAALAAGTAARDIARSNNDPYGTIFTTTSGKKDDRDGKYTYDLLQNSAPWTEKYLDCKDTIELEEVIRKAAGGRLRVNCTFNHRQLGYTDQWLKRAMEEAESTGEDAERDFLNKWTSGSLMSPLPLDVTERIRMSETEVKHFQIYSTSSYTLRFFIPQDSLIQVLKSEDLIAGIDTSDAVGNDDIGMHIRSVKTGATVAVGNFNETNLITFAMWLVELLVECPKLTLNIERRSSGATIIDYLLLMLPAKGINPFFRLYNKVIQNKEEYSTLYSLVTSKPIFAIDNEVFVQSKKYFGFATSASGATSRTELYSSTLLAAAKMTGDCTYDKKLIDQILGLTIRNGRVDHQEGGHDDLCIGWLLSMWLLINGKNLNCYGIDSRNVLCDNEFKKVTQATENSYENVYQQKLKNDIEVLVDNLKKEKNQYSAYVLEQRLRTLASKLNDKDKGIFSVDELINSIKNQRNANVSKYKPGSYLVR